MNQNLHNKTNDLDRIKKLRDIIDNYRYHYHVLDESIMSESAADSLKHELSLLEDKYPESITPDSPTQRVAGQPLPGFSQVKHSSRMLSLNDVFSEDEVQSWIKRINKLSNNYDIELFADIKMDGLACSLIYQDGIFAQAVTRGDSFVGEDVTANVRTIKNVPLKLRKTNDFNNLLIGRTEIRGEIVILKDDFDKLNDDRQKSGEALFANPRNLAAGTIRQLDPKLVAGRPLHFRAYDLIRNNPLDVPTNIFAYNALKEIGIACNKEANVCAGIKDVMDFVNTWDKKRNNLPFNTDGIVIKVNDRKLFAELGTVGKQPRAAVAFKYKAESATTIVREIMISLGRTGAATPVAVFDPVVVAGSTVQHASLHNADEINRKDIRIGDTVIIYKAGDIIPQVESVILDLRPDNSVAFDFEKTLSDQYPEYEFERPEGEVVYRVKGITGPVMLERSLEHFASKGAMDINTLGSKNVIALVESGLVKDLADIYSLTYESVLGLDRFADISAKKLVDAIEKSKSPTLARFIFGLGIRHVGIQTANDLVKAFESIDVIRNATIDDFLSIEGIGEVVADSIVAWFADPENEILLDKFKNLGVDPFYEKSAGTLSGKNFVVTGTLNSMSRDKAAEKIILLGGNFNSAITKNTNYLVAGDNVGSSKLKKAAQYGVNVINEDEFLKLIS